MFGRFRRPMPGSRPGKWPPTPFQLLKFWFKVGIVTHGFLTYVASIRGTYGVSMVPTMAPKGEIALISKYHRRGRGIQVGDVVSFKHPVRVGVGAIKRVIGMPGDYVLTGTPGQGNGWMVQVPEGHCWVAGDNLTHSRDSKIFGPLPLALVKGKVVSVCSGFPYTRWRWMENTLTEPLDD